MRLLYRILCRLTAVALAACACVCTCACGIAGGVGQVARVALVAGARLPPQRRQEGTAPAGRTDASGRIAAAAADLWRRQRQLCLVVVGGCGGGGGNVAVRGAALPLLCSRCHRR